MCPVGVRATGPRSLTPCATMAGMRRSTGAQRRSNCRCCRRLMLAYVVDGSDGVSGARRAHVFCTGVGAMVGSGEYECGKPCARCRMGAIGRHRANDQTGRAPRALLSQCRALIAVCWTRSQHTGWVTIWIWCGPAHHGRASALSCARRRHVARPLQHSNAGAWCCLRVPIQAPLEKRGGKEYGGRPGVGRDTIADTPRGSSPKVLRHAVFSPD
jgi:hypothetical protein